MATQVPYRQGDLYPALTAVLLDGVGNPIDLTPVTAVQFHLRKRNAPTAVVAAAAVVTDPTGGAVRYDWAPGDLDEPGTYDADFEIDWGTGTQTVPSTRGDFRIVVTPELA